MFRAEYERLPRIRTLCQLIRLIYVPMSARLWGSFRGRWGKNGSLLPDMFQGLLLRKRRLQDRERREILRVSGHFSSVRMGKREQLYFFFSQRNLVSHPAFFTCLRAHPHTHTLPLSLLYRTVGSWSFLVTIVCVSVKSEFSPFFGIKKQ